MKTVYKSFPVFLQDSSPPEFWTPDGYRRLPDVDLKPMRTSCGLGEYIQEAGKQGKRLLTSGEWHQTAVRFIEACPEAGRMVPNWKSMERVSTILRYNCGRKKTRKGAEYYDGLLIQSPEADDEGKLLRDSGGIPIARDVWEMALPAKCFYAKNADPVFDRLVDTLYGMENARKLVIDRAFVMVIAEGERGVLWKGWDSEDRFSIDATHEPWVPSLIVSARACSDI